MKTSSLTSIALLAFTFISAIASADSEFVNRSSIIEKPYACSNGGTIELINTRYGNVKKVVFKKPEHLNEIGYVHFSIMTEYYWGQVVPFRTFPDPNSSVESISSRTYADIEISHDGKGLKLTITPVRQRQGQGFICQNY